MLPDHLIYLHGFNSSPRSAKAALIAQYIAAHTLPIRFHTPSVPNQPRHVAAMLEHTLSELNGSVALVGSSLGGFYAAYASERFGMRAVLVNPSAHPYARMQMYRGSNENPYSGERYELDDSDLAALQRMDVPRFTEASRCLLLVQTGDEVLDYREALAKWPQCPRQVEAGGDHQFQHFERWIPAVLDFLAASG